MRWLLSYFLFVSISIAAWERKCPNGCGDANDPYRKDILIALSNCAWEALKVTSNYEHRTESIWICSPNIWKEDYLIWNEEDYKLRQSISPFDGPYWEKHETVFKINSLTAALNALDSMKNDFSIKLKSRSWLTFDECISKGREWALEKWTKTIVPYSDPWELAPDWWNEQCSSIEYGCEQSFPMVNEWLQIIPNTEIKIFQLFEEGYTHCIEKHGWRGAFYERGFLNYKLGNLEAAYDDVLKVIEASEQDGEDSNLLPTEVQLQKGMIELEIGLYNDAIVSLSLVIDKDPQNVEAYFQRAVAHFETGQFDQALQDYRSIRMEFPPEEKGLSFSLDYASGLVEGIRKGIQQELGDGLPIWAPMLNVGLWALAKSPLPQAKVVSGVLACVGVIGVYLAADQVVSELRELVTNWNHLSERERGELTGYIIGKHGIEVFAIAGSAKLIKAYQDLKRANNILTFEMLLLEEGQVASLKSRYKLIEKQRNDKEYIKKQFNRKAYPEQEIIETLQKMGYQVPPRPAEVPEHFVTRYAEGIGVCYYDPANPKTTRISTSAVAALERPVKATSTVAIEERISTDAQVSETEIPNAAPKIRPLPRTEPRNLQEQFALQEAKAGAGTEIPPERLTIKDSNYPTEDWAKMEYLHEGLDGSAVEIHFWKDRHTGETRGFKFKDKNS